MTDYLETWSDRHKIFLSKSSLIM